MASGVIILAVDRAFDLFGSLYPVADIRPWSASEKPWRRSATASSIGYPVSVVLLARVLPYKSLPVPCFLILGVSFSVQYLVCVF